MWQQEYEKLSNSEIEEFRRLVNLLMAKNYLLRDKLDSRDRTVRINHDYRFVERYYELFKEYLSISGWELQRDNNYGVICLYNRYEYNRGKLDKFTTVLLFVLRLIYEEEREKLSLKREITTSVGDIIKKMINLGLLTKKPSDKDIQNALSTIRSFNIIDKLEGSFIEYDTKIIIYPSILFIITNEKLSEIHDMLELDDYDEDELEEEEE